MSWRKKIASPRSTIETSENMITRLGPTLSSSIPNSIVETPAVTLATMPKMITSPPEKANVPAARMAP